MPVRLGITGGMGSGKSEVCRLLEVMQVPVYISDIASKRLTNSDPNIRSRLISLLGESVYCDGVLNKAVLAAYLFDNEEHVRQINDIIHPVVKEDFRRWVEQHSSAGVVAIESAILLEADFGNEVDVRVMVYAPVELRIRRSMLRDGAERDMILRRIRMQMDDEQKRQMCDVVIINDDHHSLIEQVVRMVDSITK